MRYIYFNTYILCYMGVFGCRENFGKRGGKIELSFSCVDFGQGWEIFIQVRNFSSVQVGKFGNILNWVCL